MTERMHDDHFDRELGRFLDWQAEDIAGAPTANEIAARLSSGAGARQQASRLTPQLTWALIALLATMALIGTAIVGASLLAPRPVNVVETSAGPSGPIQAATPTQPPRSPSPRVRRGPLQ